MEAQVIVTTVLGVVFAVLTPGLALSFAFFPGRKNISVPERFGLSIVLGLTPAFLMYFLDKNLSVPLNSTNTFLGYLAVTVFGILVYNYRK